MAQGIDTKFEFRKVVEGGEKIVYLSGTIDEDARFEELGTLSGPIIFDFGGVTIINSCGVRNWVNILKGMEREEAYYRNCPPPIVKQLNMVPSFRGNARVLSVYAPYVCANCDSEQRLLIEYDTSGGHTKIPETMHCKACGKEEMEIDGDLQQYTLSFK